MGARRKARELAVQMLYQYDLSGNLPDMIIETLAWQQTTSLCCITLKVN